MEFEQERQTIEAEDGTVLGVIVSDKQSATNTIVVQPANKEAAPDLMVSIHNGCVEGKFSGTVRLHYNQGGLANVVTEHVIDNLDGIFGDEEEEIEDDDENA